MSGVKITSYYSSHTYHHITGRHNLAAQHILSPIEGVLLFVLLHNLYEPFSQQVQSFPATLTHMLFQAQHNQPRTVYKVDPMVRVPANGPFNASRSSPMKVATRMLGRTISIWVWAKWNKAPESIAERPAHTA